MIDELASASCAQCANPLKGISARRLGLCADCVTKAPGDLGRRARAIVQIATDAAQDLRDDPNKLVTSAGLLRLLDTHPDSGGNVSAVPGVKLTGKWATAVAEALRA